MRLIGWSTGALARGDFRKGVAEAIQEGVPAIELSALRAHELPALLAWLPTADLTFRHVSLHAPGRVETGAEADVVASLRVVAERGIGIVVHPEAVRTPALWSQLGAALWIENMDKRKAGRTVAELRALFDALPQARFCLDLAHARQVDSTLLVARELLAAFGNRLALIHLSSVDASSAHRPLSEPVVAAFQRLAHLIPDVPVILESEVAPQERQREMQAARACFTPTADAR